ncbi:GerAB/ArcD/ProY family transporter [Peribacillus castrilensis]|uniref:GerAB/ArcD/ProY family transporter n=1 Tax=Bacillaceae TaxID=186817 RepID=UPI00061D4372|nr:MULTISPECIES: GerAB/ArcD/ProY family transporter [Bacillaceae]MCP1095935.1 spore germination protein [Bacillaceae bacterium OS4b]CRH63672.1 Spore germination protein YndE [Chlamydia trachomatis]MBD8587628.1 GerAB/ArcD/ProY family transporter [Peribacillus simplex]MCF7624058.1 spore germination protein [Peribacillus frigoritolerans]MCP1154612.1 spore germination protein [Peribacillus frigoritolerans]
MEKANISGYQLFVLIFLFEMGSALLVPLAGEAKQAAWLVILIAMVGGFLLFFIYYGLFQYYPEQLLTEFVRSILGNFLGRIVAFLYILYFIYLAARVLRDFGDTLLTFAYPHIPLFVANAAFILVVVYTVRKGVEVLTRTGELFFVLENLLLMTFFLLIVASGMIHLNNLKPVIEMSVTEMVKMAFTKTIFFPFGEIISFLMIFPYLNEPERLKKIGISSIAAAGIFLAIIMAMNIAVLGVDLTTRSQYPLLSLIQSIEVAGFLERLDVYFLFLLMIGGFIKISVFTYVAVTGTANVFNVKQPSRLAYPVGFVILLSSIIIASSFTEHMHEGLGAVPIYIHLPFQVIIPLLLLIIAFFKNRKKKKGQHQNKFQGGVDQK